MRRIKENNQWFGKAFEQVIVMLKKDLPLINPYPEHLTDNDFSDIIDDGRDFLRQYEAVTPIQTIEWIGNHTMTEDGDLIINGEVQEIKYVSQGVGTWVNCTINHLYRYLPDNFPSHIDFMREVGLLDKFTNFTKSRRWEKNHNTTGPLSRPEAKEASKLPNNGGMLALDRIWRAAFVQAVFKNLCSNPVKLQQFLDDCVTKNIIGKATPKHLLVYNYRSHTLCNMATVNTIQQHPEKYHANDFGFTLGQIRISIYWKNQIGNNLAMNVFLNKED